jgi:hypothetical protein
MGGPRSARKGSAGRMEMSEPSKDSKTIKLAERRVFSQSFKPLYN